MKRRNVVPTLGILLSLLGLGEALADEGATKTMKACVVIGGADGKVTAPAYHRITSDEAWTKIWQENNGPGCAGRTEFNGMPMIDFDNYMVVALFEGKSINCYGLSAVSIRDNGAKILFRYERNCYQTMSSVHVKTHGDEMVPYAFFVLPRSKKAIVVEEDVHNIIGQPPQWKERETLPEIP